MEIKIIMLDIDGVINSGEATDYNIDLLKYLAKCNDKSKVSGNYPAITLCTGRPAPYAEALSQVIRCNYPCLFEHGTGMYLSESYQFKQNPYLKDMEKIQSLYLKLKNHYKKKKMAFLQLGKEFTVSFFPEKNMSLKILKEECKKILGKDIKYVDAIFSRTCLNIIPKNFHKGEGIRFFSDVTKIKPEEILSVGDSEVDLPMFKATGYSACPNNSSEKIKNKVDYCAKNDDIRGIKEIFKYFNCY